MKTMNTNLKAKEFKQGTLAYGFNKNTTAKTAILTNIHFKHC